MMIEDVCPECRKTWRHSYYDIGPCLDCVTRNFQRIVKLLTERYGNLAYDSFLNVVRCLHCGATKSVPAIGTTRRNVEALQCWITRHAIRRDGCCVTRRDAARGRLSFAASLGRLSVPDGSEGLLSLDKETL